MNKLLYIFAIVIISLGLFAYQKHQLSSNNKTHMLQNLHNEYYVLKELQQAKHNNLKNVLINSSFERLSSTIKSSIQYIRMHYTLSTEEHKIISLCLATLEQEKSTNKAIKQMGESTNVE